MIFAPILGAAIGGPPKSGAVAAENVTPDKWHRDLAVPPQTSLTQYAYAVAIIASGVIVDPYILTQPEAVTIDRWQQPLSEPAVYRASSYRALQVSEQMFYTAEPQPEDLDFRAWYAPLEQPYPIPRRMETGSQQHVVFTQIYAIPIDRWLQPLSEPRRVAFARGLDTGSQQSLVYTYEYAIPIDRWLQPLSEPTAYRALSYRALQVTEQMFYTAEPQPEDLDFRAWYAPLSEPRLFAYERHLPIALYPSMFQFGQFTRNYNLLAERLHSIHDGTVQLAASHHGSVMLHGVPDGDLPESV